MAALAPGTRIINRFRNYFGEQREAVFRLRVKNGIPHLIGKYGTYHKVKESDFTDDDRYFVEVKT